MARINENLLVRGARGNVARQFVYKKHGDETHIARMPRVKKDAPISDGQEKVRDMFTEASLYAKGAMSSPELKKEYQKKVQPGITAFNVAFKDYQKPPKVKSIDTKEYDGTPGSTIVVKAKDDFRVVRVKVSIYTADNVLVEEGDTILNPVNRNKWIYTARLLNANMQRWIVKAIAFDMPENEGSLEVTM